MTFLRSSGEILGFALSLSVLLGSGCGNGSSSASPGTTRPGAGTGAGGQGRGPAPVALGTAGNFVILAQAGITDIPTSAILGDLGLYPATGANITGVSCSEITGTVFSRDAASGPGAPCTSFNQSTALNIAINDKGTAYTDAGSRAPDYTELATGSLGGLNLAPATYKFSTGVSITSDLTLTGGANDVWIFQIAQGLSIAAGVRVTLAGGALPEHVFWQVVAAADLGTTSAIQGTIISATSIVVKTGASVTGKLLAGTNVTLDHNAITKTP